MHLYILECDIFLFIMMMIYIYLRSISKFLPARIWRYTSHTYFFFCCQSRVYCYSVKKYASNPRGRKRQKSCLFGTNVCILRIRGVKWRRHTFLQMSFEIHFKVSPCQNLADIWGFTAIVKQNEIGDILFCFCAGKTSGVNNLTLETPSLTGLQNHWHVECVVKVYRPHWQPFLWTRNNFFFLHGSFLRFFMCAWHFMCLLEVEGELVTTVGFKSWSRLI